MAGEDAQGALGTAGAMDRAGIAAVPLAPHGTPSLCPPNAAARRLRTEGPHAEGREFSPGAFPELTAPMGLPGDHWVDLRRHWLEM